MHAKGFATYSNTEPESASLVNTNNAIGDDTASPNAADLIHHAFQHSREGMALLNRNHKILYANPVMERVYAHQAPLLGQHCYRVFYDQASPCAWCHDHVDPPSSVVHVLPPNTSTTATFSSMPLWLPIRCVPHGAADCTAAESGYIIYANAILNRQRIEGQLERERAYLTSAIDLLPMPMLFFSASAPTARMNRAMRDFLCPDLRLQDVQLLDPDTHSVIPRDMRPESRALQGEVISFFETIIALPDAREIPVIGHAAPIFVNEEQVAVVLAFQDITAIKETDRAKDQFLAVLSHELLTPLTSILGWAQTAREQNDPAMMAQALTIIERNAQRQRRIVDDLLDMSRIIHGKLSLQFEVTDLYHLAEQAVESAMQMARERKITLALEPLSSTVPIFADAARITQVIGNLIQNGLKFSEAGDRITLSCQVQDEHVARLTVQDTGRGIPIEEQHLLFKPFCQIERREDTGGLGLGLALIKGLVELHGGHITGHSAGLAYGSTFIVELPLFDRKRKTAMRAASYSSTDTPPPNARKNGESRAGLTRNPGTHQRRRRPEG